MGAAGVGLLVEAGVGGSFHVRDLVPGQPASRSALQVGDELQRIDGRDLLGMTLSQVFSLLTGSPGSSVSITARSAATRHKYVCKLVRQTAPKPAGPVSKPQAAAKAQGSVSPAVASPSPSKEPSKFGVGPRLAWHADFSEAPREHDRNAEEEPAQRDSNGAACALAQTNERLKAELLRTRQELLGSLEQQQAVELVKGRNDNAIALLKARVAELGEELEFEKRRGSKWKVAALALPRLEEEFHSLSLSFRVSQAEFARNLSNLMQQESQLRGTLQHRLEHEQAKVDSMVAVERKRLNEVRTEYEATQHQMEHLNRSMQLEIARQQESHEAAMSRAAQNSADQEARLKALHADQEAKLKEQEENVRLMHSREIEALRTQNADAHRQASAAEVALQAARGQIENARQQQQELRTEHARVINELQQELRTEHARVINELHAAHAQVVQDLIKNHKDQMFRVEKEFSDKKSSADLEQSSVLQATEQRAHALANEIEGLHHDNEACVRTLREEMEKTKLREMQALQRDHEASVEALQKELEKQRADADGVRRALQECISELAVKEEVAKCGLGESEKLLQAAADDAEKLELSLSLTSRNIREFAADRNRCKAETAAVLSSVSEVLMKTQDLEHELSKRKDLEAQLESLSAREKNTALQSKSDIEALTAKQAEIIQTLVARAENEKQALHAEMQKEIEGCKVAARQEKESLETVLQEQRETMKREHDQTLQNLQQMERSKQAEIIQTLVARAENEKQALRGEMQKEVEGILRTSRDLSYEIAMAIDSQREAERCFHVAFSLELRTLVSWMQSTQADVTNLMDALASESAPKVLHLQPDFDIIDESFSPGVLERHMEDRLAELEHSFHLSTVDRDQQQKHSDCLANELTRLCTENLALQTAITTQQQQLYQKDKFIKLLQQIVQDANGSATRLSEELRLLQDEVVHLKQSYATELDGLEREHISHVRLASGVAVEASTSSQTVFPANRTTPTHVELSPSSLHGSRDNMTAPSRSPPTLSPDVGFFQRLRDPSSWDGNRTIPRAQPLLQSPLFGIYVPSRRSPSAFLSSKQDGIQNDGQERSPVEGTPANGQIFAETLSELYRSIELRRENQRLRAALEQSRSLPQTPRISHGKTWQVARVLPDFLQTQIYDRRLLSPVDDSSSHNNLCRELEQANKARDELLETIQLQSAEILQLHQRLKSRIPSPEITLMTPKPESEMKASYDPANMQEALGSARKELEQSLVARDDLLR